MGTKIIDQTEVDFSIANDEPRVWHVVSSDGYILGTVEREGLCEPYPFLYHPPNDVLLTPGALRRIAEFCDRANDS